MKYRNLGPYSASELGLGCASYWGHKHFSEKQAARVVQAAFDTGVNYLDTGASYSSGHAEQRLGRIFNHANLPESLIISTKVGTEIGTLGRLYKDFSRGAIIKSCQRSLRRLGTEQLKLLFLHGPNIEDFNENTYRALAELKQSGQVGLIGVNTFNPHIIKRTQQCGQFDVLMTDFNVFKPNQADTLKQTRQLGMEVIVAGALGGALYSRQWQQFKSLKNYWYHLRAWKNNRHQLKAAKQFDFLNNHPNLSATQLALAYVFNNPDFSSALVGSTSEINIRQLAEVSGQSITQEWLTKIQNTQKHINLY